ncbi:Ankyrin repeat domain-containing protein 50 [Talaromyces islandicus]|uniref:Ankyrin repeat domain-containing protein 50 n=1 Tax=Talaromyces islandicus TaxID=28573 RepID=A0A0U1M7Y9_TALIS|nr:Ankyrin repeat domain-containing protein 50 [Talaromyces islandicus]
MKRRRLRCEDYTVGWICALPIEFAAAIKMLDEEDEDLPHGSCIDADLYTLGRIGEHNVVVACLPAGQIGTNSAAAVAVNMKSKFRSIRFALMVGIGGGVPSRCADIRLGDVVISQPEKQHGGVVQHDFGKATPDGFSRTGFLNAPPRVLLSALSKLRANHSLGRSCLPKFLSLLIQLPQFTPDSAGPDILFEPTYEHLEGETCEACNKERQITRIPRGDVGVTVHHGTIASGNWVMRDGVTRDRVSTDLGGVLCFEMEAAGLMNNFPCLVIRGICDYADSHKNKKWQGYAAGTAAACAKEVLLIIPTTDITPMPTVDKVFQLDKVLRSAIDNVDIEIFLSLLKAIDQEELISRIPLLDSGEPMFYWIFRNMDFKQWSASMRKFDDAAPGELIEKLLHAPSSDLWAALSEVIICEQHELLFVIDGLDKVEYQEEELLARGILEFLKNLQNRDAKVKALLTGRPKTEIKGILDGMLYIEHDILKLLFDTCTSMKHGTLKVFIASRPVGQLEIRLNKFHNIIRLQDETKSDIIRYAHSFLEYVNLTQLLTKVMEYIVENAQGVFLWVKLVGEEILALLAEGCAEEDTFEFLKSLPTELNHYYVRMLGKMIDRDRDLRDGIKLFHFVLFGKRPLAPNELLHALAVSDELHAGYSLSYTSFRRRIPLDQCIIHCGGNFLEIRSYNGTNTSNARGPVQVIHQTVREFFLRPNGYVANSKFKMNEKDAHKSISITCVRYLMICATKKALAQSQPDVLSWSPQHFEDFAQNLDEMQFANYALCYLKHHIGDCQDVSVILSKFIDGLIDTQGAYAYLLGRWVASQFNNQSLETKLGYAAGVFRDKLLFAGVRKGYLTATEVVLTVEANVNVEDEEGRRPLSWAAVKGFEAVVRLLLENGTDIESKDNIGSTPLSLAAANGHEAVVKLLLEKGANIESKNNISWTPLSLAAANGHNAVVKLLLEKGADIESRDHISRTPLSLAAANGNVAEVNLLLDNGAKVDPKDDEYGRTPLAWAAMNTHEAVVKLLLSKGAKVEAKDNIGRALLSWAAVKGHETLAKLLLKEGADIESKDNIGQTPLSLAAANGHEAVAKLLIAKGANVKSKNVHGLTALSLAAVNGHESVLEMLLINGAEIEPKNIYSWTPLSWAAVNGHEALAELLLSKGSDIESKDNIGQTPLSLAAANGHEAVVKLLIAKSANVKSKNMHGLTALSLAAVNGHKAVIELLFSSDAEIESKDSVGRTPLSWAAVKGHEAVTLSLLSKDADIESKDRIGQTPLSLAAANGHEVVVKLLLDRGADTRSKDNKYDRTPLGWAKINKHKVVAKLLQKNDFEIKAKDSTAWSSVS